MGGLCHGDNVRILLINRNMSYIVTADQVASMTINRACVWRGVLNLKKIFFNNNIPIQQVCKQQQIASGNQFIDAKCTYNYHVDM